MRRLLAHTHGEPEMVLSVQEVPDDPSPEAGEVQVEIQAVGLNFLDVMLCRGDYPHLPDPPYTPGVELAGRVVAAGAAAEHLLGLEVIACPTLPRGALGDSVTVSADLVMPRPAEMSPVVAAALPVVYQTAWFAFARANLAAGETVLVHSGAGGVGAAAIQLAVERGATVIATAGGPAKVELCRQHGAAVAIDYLQDDFVTAVYDATAGRGVDVVCDPVGAEVFARSLECLAFEGRLVALGSAGGPLPPVDAMRLMGSNVTVIGLSWGSAYPWLRPQAVADAYRAIFDLWRRGLVRPPIARVVSLEEVPATLADLAARRIAGKCVVTLLGGKS